MSKTLKSKMIRRWCIHSHSQHHRVNNGTTGRNGHRADCQLALMNVVEEQKKVVAMDKKNSWCNDLTQDQ